MPASTAAATPRPSSSTSGGDAARLRKRGDELRAAGSAGSSRPITNDAQLRHQLQREGFDLDAIGRYLRGEDQEPAKPAAAPKPPAPRASGDLWQGPGTASGVLLALICYPAGLAYLRGGGPGLKAWMKAKFLNQTSTDPGIVNEAWLTPGGTSTSGGTITTSFTGRKRRRTPAPAGGSVGSGAGAAAVAFARAQIGLPYEWGGDGPGAGDKGYDCSGLTQASWAAAGVHIPRTTAGQITLKSVRRRDMQPGDLIFPEPTHVQLYAGGGRIIEAPRLGLKVREMPLGFVMAVRRPRAGRKGKGVLT